MFHRRTKSRRRAGFTLLEVLVATAVTLLMMVSLAKIFKIIGDSMQKGRAALELNNQLRNVSLQIQRDLANATIKPKPPADPTQGEGYFKYYDGALTDFSFAEYEQVLPVNSDADPLNNIYLSRFGDPDDVLMFTARADDVWYTGKVPLFVLQSANTSTPVPIDPDPTNPTYNTYMVTISSQYAEIVLFAEPVVTRVGNVDQSPNLLIADPNNYEVVPGTDVPAKYRLYYRTLLIRPDLNMPGGFLPNDGMPPTSSPTPFRLIAQPTVVGGTTLPSPTCDMAFPHNQCDLSLRRTVPYSTLAPTSTVSANSLEDLANPANRFAHIQLPLASGTRSMPILALSTKMTVPFTDLDAGAYAASTSPLDFQSGFLHPAFTLFDADRIGEDILASDILAFDVKGFDSGAPIIATVGPDGVPGNAGDDDLDSAVDNATELGWKGSDDLILTPGDPGYGPALTGVHSVIGSGAFVDVGWGWKARVHSPVTIPADANMFSELSGLGGAGVPPAFLAAAPFSETFYRSGQVIHVGPPTASNVPIIFQPAYDSWTSRFENDGILQAETDVAGRRGVVEILPTAPGPALRVPRDSWRVVGSSYLIDAGSDGIDNDGNTAIDDAVELETRAPFESELPGVRVTIRMEDPATRQIKQMSVGREFVTQ